MSSDWFHIPGTGTIVSPSRGVCAIQYRESDFHNKLMAAIPEAKTGSEFGMDGRYLTTVPLHEDSMKILHNLGWNIAGMEPFHYFYTKPRVEGMYDAMPHQAETAAFIASHARCYCFNTMRTGKTGSLALAFDYLMRVKGVPGAALIVTTVSTMGGVWERTLKTTLRDRRVIKVYGDGKAERLRLFNYPADFYVTNYDTIKLLADELERAVVDGKINMVGVDELTHYGEPGSDRWKALNGVINGKRRQPAYVCGMTGSPGGNPMHAYGMVKLITPHMLGGTTKSAWENMVLQRWGSKVWQKSERPEAKGIIKRVMSPQIRFEKEDIMTLPPVVTVRKEALLTREQVGPYNDMLNNMLALSHRGELITAVNKAAMFHKLFQIALGSVIKENGDTTTLDNKARLAVILETIREAEAKTVIFAVYKAHIYRLVQQLREAKLTVEAVTGDVTGSQRDTIFDNFQNARDPQVLVAHPMTVSFGVELSSADTMIFDGPPHCTGEFIYSQALARLSSNKQKARQITIVEVTATAEERESFKDVNSGVRVATSFNRIFADLTKGRA